MEKYPKISCVMITQGDINKIRQSITCYLKQIYPYKELVILSQCKDNVNRNIRQYIHEIHPDISFFVVPESLSLAGMRNMNIELTRGEVICQWNEDDFSHPLRLIRQYNALNGHRVVASMYQEHLQWFKDSDEIFWVDWSIENLEDRRYLYSTSMFLKETFCKLGNLMYSGQFPDQESIKKILELGKIAGIKDGFHYIRTCDEKDYELLLRKHVYTAEELTVRKKMIERSLNECEFGRSAKICSSQGVAFELEM